jgi:hypothetical protein
LLLLNLNKTSTNGIPIAGTKNAICFSIGSSSELYGTNLTAEQIKESSFIQTGKIIVMAACVDKKYVFFLFFERVYLISGSLVWYFFGGMVKGSLNLLFVLIFFESN